MLAPGGLLISQCADIANNLWDILSYDQVNHFSRYTIAQLFIKNGFVCEFPKNQIVRQITIIGKKSNFDILDNVFNEREISLRGG